MKKGFTLIELLVVVLIIGILAAIALPKYQTAVNKSRYAGLMPLARSIKNAEEIIHMDRGAYSNKIDDLSISLPGTVDGATVTNSDGTTLTVTSTDTHNFVKATKTGLNNNYVMYFAKSANFPNGIHCEALKDNASAKQICLSYGPLNTTPITGTDSNYDTYVLEGNTTDTGSGVPQVTYWNDTEIPIGVINYIEGDSGHLYNITSYSLQGDGTYALQGDIPFTYNPQAHTLEPTGTPMKWYFDESGNWLGNSFGGECQQGTCPGL